MWPGLTVFVSVSSSQCYVARSNCFCVSVQFSVLCGPELTNDIPEERKLHSHTRNEGVLRDDLEITSPFFSFFAFSSMSSAILKKKLEDMKVTFPLSICVISLKFVSILKVCHSKRHIFLASVHLGMGEGGVGEG